MSASRTYPANSLRTETEATIYRANRTFGAVEIRDPWAAIRTGLERHRYRRELQRLLRVGPHMIDDIGLTQAKARHEMNKPFWRR